LSKARAFCSPTAHRAARPRRGSGDVVCEIVNGGLLGEHKGINLPAFRCASPRSLKRRGDLEFALKNGVTHRSFLCAHAKIFACANALRHWALKPGSSPSWKSPGHRTPGHILSAADAIMWLAAILASRCRGDGSRPSKAHHSPRLRASQAVITATQMLESMIENPRPPAPRSPMCQRGLRRLRRRMLSGESQ